MPDIRRMVRIGWAHLSNLYYDFLDLPKRIRLSAYAATTIVVIVCCCWYLGTGITAQVDRVGAMCKPDYPLAITVTNHTFKDILRVRMILDVRDAASKKNELFSDHRVFEWKMLGETLPLQPWEQRTLCFSDYALSSYRLEEYVSPKVYITAYDVDYSD